MANTVITFAKNALSGTYSSTSQQLEVYIDIDTDSVRNQNYIQDTMVQVSDYIAYLGTELSTNVSNLSDDISIICPEQVIDDDNEYQVITGIAVELSVGYDQLYALYEKHTSPSRYRISRLINVKAVQNSLHQIFTWIPGERIINPEFGSKLQLYLYEGITDSNIEAIMAEIKHAVSIWEPRVTIDRVVNVRDVNDDENNTVRLDVYYHILGLNDELYRYTYNYYRNSL